MMDGTYQVIFPFNVPSTDRKFLNCKNNVLAPGYHNKVLLFLFGNLFNPTNKNYVDHQALQQKSSSMPFLSTDTFKFSAR